MSVGLTSILAITGAVGLLFNGRYPDDIFRLVLARIHRRTPMDGVRIAAE